MFLFGSLISQLWTELINGEFASLGSQLLQSQATLANLGTSLIDVSSFWMSYILLKGLGVLVELAQAFALLLILLQRKLFVRRPTPRQLREFARPPAFMMAELYATHLFLFSITLMFAIVSPIIVVVGFVAFVLSLLVYKYQVMYVYTVKTETAGAIWFPIVFNRLVAALVAMQLVMLGATNLSYGTTQSFALLPLPILTLMINWFHSRRYRNQFKYIAESLDDSNEPPSVMNADKQPASASDDRYLHRALSAPLYQVLVSRTVAQRLADYYDGPYIVDGDRSSMSALARYTISRRRASQDYQAVRVGESPLPAIPDSEEYVLNDSDIEEDDVYEVLEAEQGDAAEDDPLWSSGRPENMDKV